MPETGLTLFALAMPVLAVILLLMAAVLAVRTRGVRRFGWGFCAVLIAGGMLATGGVLCCMPAMVDQDGAVIGEMPPAFALSLMGIALGCGGVLLGLLRRTFSTAIGRRR
ncbi:hypothetical protein VY88_11130 [Azospirillum thiophilum]|uniref:Uncharacterized protein n=1 Tax=Azospirillum thiophilum TaxID=528244 RepID=A0AAC8VUQ7_9PROT|nr:hypothetical protein [Azospirillum thiophilum]ALG69829.1 hypothetical protein AL072_01575 [Azospirillum thiophilum]KJR66487.1 hypothetical protein VY88_11130 [Azospirillum thiophilum]